MVGNAAHALGLQALTIDSSPENDEFDASSYVVVSAQSLPLSTKEWDDGGKSEVRPTKRNPRHRLWTDDYSNLFSVLVRPEGANTPPEQ